MFGIGDVVIETPADLRKWLPGDQVFDGNIFIPPSVKPGSHRLRVAVLDRRMRKPAVRLAIAGLQADGWYDLGEIRVE